MELGIEICTRVAEGKPLTKVCKMAGMPGLTTVYAWIQHHFEFDQLMRRARSDVADTFFSRAIEVAEQRCANSVEVQRNRLLIDTLKWAAAKMAPRRYSDQLAIGGSEDLPPVRMDGVEAAKRIAFVLARAGRAIEQQSATTPQAPAPVDRLPAQLQAHRERVQSSFGYRMQSTAPEAAVDFDVEESADEMGRIGDPRRVVSEPDTGRQPLSRRAGHQPT